MRATDITGQKFGRLTALHSESIFTNEGCHRRFWLCRCDCGEYIYATATSLKSGNAKSCGCLKREMLIERNTSHDMSKTILYHVWLGMKRRCYAQNDANYPNYGGRGIVICDEWLDFTAFYNWAINNGYEVKKSSANRNVLSIDRIDNNGNYEPGNCRWVDNIVQSYNRRDTFKVLYGDKYYTVKDLADITGFKKRTIYARLKNGWTVEEAISIQPLSGNNGIARKRENIEENNMRLRMG